MPNRNPPASWAAVRFKARPFMIPRARPCISSFRPRIFRDKGRPCGGRDAGLRLRDGAEGRPPTLPFPWIPHGHPGTGCAPDRARYAE
jgi:hypothetical protein